jgi:starch synthase
MAEAVAGLVRQLRADGIDVTVALPDYGTIPVTDAEMIDLDTPDWAGDTKATLGRLAGPTDEDRLPVALIDGAGMAKAHPYNDDDGNAFPDNDLRFFAFSAGVAALTRKLQPDVLHLNDWHSAATLGLLGHDEAPPSILSIHTLGYQGVTDVAWIDRLARGASHFVWYGGTNPLLGGIVLADKVVTVSPNYAAEILTEAHGMGLHQVLADRGDDLTGVINGIDVGQWNPATDPALVANYAKVGETDAKAANRLALLERAGLPTTGTPQPLIGVVTRLVEQKGIDLLVELTRYLEHLPARLLVLGSGDAALADRLDQVAAAAPDRVAFVNGYDAALSHQIFAGADLLVMPSRFEPCGLAQMQAMAYGTVPVVTAVGGLVDTVIDADADREHGNGFVSATVDTTGLIDALHRATRAWFDTGRFRAIRRRGMKADWSWKGPAKTYASLYRQVLGHPDPQ